jgi:hypothetical protein
MKQKPIYFNFNYRYLWIPNWHKNLKILSHIFNKILLNNSLNLLMIMAINLLSLLQPTPTLIAPLPKYLVLKTN